MSERRIKICIIPPQKLPVPAVRGGAVEGLLDLLINENEIENKMDITIISKYDYLAKEKSKKYKNTQFIFIHYNEILDKIFYKIKDYLFRFFKIKIRVHLYTLIYNLLITFKKYDLIVIESADPQLSLITKKNRVENIVGHIHGKMAGNSLMDNKYGYFIAISEFIKAEFLKNSDISNDRIYILKNGIDLSKFDINLSKEEAKEKIGLKDKKIILFVGRIIKEKGIKELILAFNKINNNNDDDDEKLIIIGSSNFGNKDKTSFEYEIEQLVSNNKNIVQLGYLDNSLIIEYYKAADVAVMPSIWEEPAGLVALESLACGTPLITTISGGLPEYISQNDALMLNIDDQLISNLAFNINKILSCPKLASELSEHGKITVKKYSQKKYYNEYYDILCDILKRNQKG